MVASFRCALWEADSFAYHAHREGAMTRFVLGGSLLLAVACSAVTGPVSDLNGAWVGHLQSTWSVAYHLMLRQQGQGVKGMGALTGDLSTPGSDSVQITGTYVRPLVMLDLTIFVDSIPAPLIHFSGRAIGDRLEGVDQIGDSMEFVRP